MKFKDLHIGDLFNTKSGRYVKTEADKAIVVLSGMYSLGDILSFAKETEVIVLYTQNRQWRVLNGK